MVDAIDTVTASAVIIPSRTAVVAKVPRSWQREGRRIIGVLLPPALQIKARLVADETGGLSTIRGEDVRFAPAIPMADTCL